MYLFDDNNNSNTNNNKIFKLAGYNTNREVKIYNINNIIPIWLYINNLTINRKLGIFLFYRMPFLF